MGLVISKQSDGGVMMVATIDEVPRIPVGYRPLLEGEQPDEFDLVFSLLLNEWHELGEDGIWSMQMFGFANPVPLCRRIGESEV